jgi:hypothetical protein
MTPPDPRQFLEALSAPFGELIAAVGRGVADAQRALDAGTIAQLREIYQNPDDESFRLLRLINYQPTWYTIPETTGELSVALTLSGSVEATATPSSRPVLSSLRLYAAPVDAGYANKYNFNLQATSKLTFRIVPVPPTPLAEQLRVMPDLDGRTFQEITDLLTQLGISFAVKTGEPQPVATDRVKSYEPAAGTVLRAGEGVTLSFKA